MNCKIFCLCRYNSRLPAQNFLSGYENKVLKSASISPHIKSNSGNLKFLDWKNKLGFETETGMQISDYWSDYERLVANSLQEGESPMTFEGYNFVCLQAPKMKESC